MNATSDYLAVWDADVIFSPSQVYEALVSLRSGKYEVCYPYDGLF